MCRIIEDTPRMVYTRLYSRYPGGFSQLISRLAKLNEYRCVTAFVWLHPQHKNQQLNNERTRMHARTPDTLCQNIGTLIYSCQL